MANKILVSDGFHPELFKELCAVEGLEVHPVAKVNQAELPSLLATVEGLVIRSATTVNESLLEAASNLKLVIRAGEGTDNIDKKLCECKNITVENTPGANNNSAAEHAVALILTVLRHTATAHRTMVDGKWAKSNFMGNELWKKKVGIVGFGRIGQIVAKRISGFEPDAYFFDPFIKEAELNGAKKVESLEEIFKTCDIITLHTPLMDATKGMVNSELLNSMKSDAILVNASRGGIVDEEALLAVLKDKKIRGAGFDVFATEPLPEVDELRKLENFIMTPHLGASTQEAQYRVGEMVIHQLKEFFLNNNVLNQVKA